MSDVFLAAVGALAVAVAVLSARLQRVPLSAPLLALVTGVVLGPAVTGAISPPTVVEATEEVHEASRLLLAVSVMAVALRYPLRDVRARARPVALLVLVAMVGMAATTTVVAAAVPVIGLTAAFLLGAALCPTDPVLASGVATGGFAEGRVPARTRQLLSLESGANDGLALPLVLAAVAVAGSLSGPSAAGEALWQVLGGVVLGGLSGAAGGRLLRGAERRREVESGPALVYTLLLALLVLGVSGLLRMDGILAVFAAGLAFNATGPAAERAEEARIDETVNTFLVLPLFVLLGAMLPWDEWAELGWGNGLALVGGVLLLRRLPILLLLARPLDLRTRDAVFLGWFGPMGVSALFYLCAEAQRLGADPRVLAAGTLVVAASTVVHGITTAPGVLLYRRAALRSPDPSP
ncbi:cation:proton antiporter domain-containing protein [Streptomyces calidiresistens]|uniref:Sodium:proton exchanger n=1 Tax=Streptomyces calidiresistens TaxID=1485586 RepID=A0A7W3XYK1_9ACTN|nr:cation:proton antiporter [Streptomyces calidiresistens]MBB0232235.1 sodium:proton exchanger [Streptomyces calidiresistens]